MNQIANGWKDYEVLDTGNKEKLERWNNVILRRPDPVAIWPIQDETAWKKADAVYHRSNKGGGSWEYRRPIKENWTIGYKDLRFKISPTGFKHTGLFPEQGANWDFIMQAIRQRKQTSDAPIRILNLFAYTGGATMAAAKAGADETVHVDASKGIVAWAKENMVINHLEDKTIRFIVDDVVKFVRREIRRGRKYDGIILDPPSYGRGPNQELWKLEDQLYELLDLCSQLLSDDPLFMIVNCYTTGFPLSALAETMKRLLTDKRGGQVEVGENLLPVTKGGCLPCGIFGRWTPDCKAPDKP
jgi:23S rRNA (cytosine1962-C5)-methyltransferase